MKIVLSKMKSLFSFENGNDIILSFLIALYFLLLPFEEAFATPIGTINSIIGLFLIFYILIKYRNGSFPVNIFSISIIIWLGYLAISSFWSYYINWWFYFFKIYLGQVCFLLILSIVPFEKYNFSFIEKIAMLTGVVVTAILVLFPDKSSLEVQNRRTIIINGTELDPNILSAIMGIGALFSIKGIFDSKLLKAIFRTLILFVIVVGVFLTGSRGGLLALAFSIFVYLLLELKNKRNRYKVAICFLIIIIAIIVAIFCLPKELLERFKLENLFGLTETNPFYHTRFNIWKYAIQSWSLKPLFGYGCGNFFRAIEITYKQCASHNMFILQLTEGGLFGLIIFLIPVVSILYKIIKNKNYINIPIFVFIIFMGLTLDNLQNKYFWFGLFYIYLFTLNKHQNSLEEVTK